MARVLRSDLKRNDTKLNKSQRIIVKNINYRPSLNVIVFGNQTNSRIELFQSVIFNTYSPHF